VTRDLVVIGGSWGGLHALEVVLAGLPAGFAGAVAIAQHRGSALPELLAPLLARRSPLDVRDAEDKDRLCPGHAYLAPGGYHLLVEDGSLALSTEAAVHHSRPSIDVLFASAADAYGERLVGVLLTGSNADGAEGLLAIAGHGGYTIVQDPEEAERREMPDSALALLRPDAVVPLAEVAPLLVGLVGEAVGSPG
jgi:two-component system chemotaxis response regulator CheB